MNVTGMYVPTRYHSSGRIFLTPMSKHIVLKKFATESLRMGRRSMASRVRGEILASMIQISSGVFSKNLDVASTMCLRGTGNTNDRYREILMRKGVHMFVEKTCF